MIFDTHAHYDDDAFDEDREDLIKAILESDIKRIVNVGANLKTSRNSIDLANKYDLFYAAVGVHPDDCDEVDDAGIDKLREMSREKKVVAIGEIGLDYYWHKDNPDIQKNAFKRQIELAQELSLPIIIHSREAARDTMDILAETNAGVNSGVVHCFSYSPEIALEAIKLGFYVGVGGVVTFKNAKKLKETVERIPLEKIVLETDCPYLAPVPFRAKRNSSLYLEYVVEEIAMLKQTDVETVKEITYKNALDMYRLAE
ncbi:MAG: TatD family hydrolase [Lachnospiraceae bacterium]|nr:TatD family hydrolase [Lachnospiraceae bacterium]MBR5066358.1 TatD family hydrolase [Lachnospiraceae bacterium]